MIPDEKIQEAVLEVFDLRPAAIIADLDLLRPIYAKTAAYGHFGRELPEFTWERTDRADALKAAAGHLTDRPLLGRTRDAVRGPRLACVQQSRKRGPMRRPTRRSSVLSAVVLAGVVAGRRPAGPRVHRGTRSTWRRPASATRDRLPRTRRGDGRA